VVKNAAGYNMCRLMAGSRGTLAIITQATLMVRPLPEAAALLACDLPEFELAETLLANLVRSQARPVAVELSAGRSIEGNPLFGPILPGNIARLYVGFRGLGRRSRVDVQHASRRMGCDCNELASGDTQSGDRQVLALDCRVPLRRNDRCPTERSRPKRSRAY